MFKDTAAFATSPHFLKMSCKENGQTAKRYTNSALPVAHFLKCKAQSSLTPMVITLDSVMSVVLKLPDRLSEIKSELLKPNRLHRTYRRNQIRRNHKENQRNEEGAYIQNQDSPKVDVHRRYAKVIVGFVELDEPKAILQPAQADADQVAPKQTRYHDVGGVVEKNAPDAPVGGAQGFQDADHIGPLEDKNEQSCHHIDDGNAQH